MNENTHVEGGNVNNNNHIRTGCTYKEFSACKPIEFDGKGGALAYTRWIEKMESIIDISNCATYQRVKYAACLLSGKALTWWNTQLQARGRESAVSMTWEEFKALLKEEYCPDNEMQKLENELWHHTMIGAGHAAYTDRFHELAKLVPHLVTPESKRIERYIYGLTPEIRGTVRTTEPSTIQSAILKAGTLTDEMIRNGTLRDIDKRKTTCETGEQTRTIVDNKRARLFVTAGSNQKGYGGTHPKCVKCNYHHQKSNPCYVCTHCNQFGHLVNRCRMLGNGGNTRNNQKNCYECNSPNHFRSACPRLNKTQRQVQDNQTLALILNGDNTNQRVSMSPPRGRAYYLGTEAARNA